MNLVLASLFTVLGFMLGLRSYLKIAGARRTLAEVLWTGAKFPPNGNDDESMYAVVLRYSDEQNHVHCVTQLMAGKQAEGSKVSIYHHRDKPEIILVGGLVAWFGAALIAFTLALGAWLIL